MIPVLSISRSIRYLRKLAGCEIGSPTYSSRWNIATRLQSIPCTLVSSSKNAICDVPVATTMRASPRSPMARRIVAAACSAAALLSDALSSNTFRITLQSLLSEPPPAAPMSVGHVLFSLHNHNHKAPLACAIIRTYYIVPPHTIVRRTGTIVKFFNYEDTRTDI